MILKILMMTYKYKINHLKYNPLDGHKVSHLSVPVPCTEVCLWLKWVCEWHLSLSLLIQSHTASLDRLNPGEHSVVSNLWKDSFKLLNITCLLYIGRFVISDIPITKFSWNSFHTNFYSHTSTWVWSFFLDKVDRDYILKDVWMNSGHRIFKVKYLIVLHQLFF